MCGVLSQQRRAAMPSPLAPRQRKQVKYTEKDTPGKGAPSSDDDASAMVANHSSSDGSSGSELEDEPVRKDHPPSLLPLLHVKCMLQSSCGAAVIMPRGHSLSRAYEDGQSQLA